MYHHPCQATLPQHCNLPLSPPSAYPSPVSSPPSPPHPPATNPLPYPLAVASPWPGMHLGVACVYLGWWCSEVYPGVAASLAGAAAGEGGGVPSGRLIITGRAAPLQLSDFRPPALEINYEERGWLARLPPLHRRRPARLCVCVCVS